MAHTRMPGVQGINAKARLCSEDGTLARHAASIPGVAGSGIPRPAGDSPAPAWFRQLRWSKVWTVAALRTQQREIPDWPGCYVFTKSSMPLRPEKVLYIGKSINLRDRLGTYLTDYRKSQPPRHEPTSGPTEQKKKQKLHKGRLFIFHHRHESGADAIFVRWVLYGSRPEELEANLVITFGRTAPIDGNTKSFGTTTNASIRDSWSRTRRSDGHTDPKSKAPDGIHRAL